MSVYEFNSIEKNFDSLVEDINKFKVIATAKIKSLEDANDIKKIQKLDVLHLDNVKLESYIESGMYSDSSVKVKINFSSETIKLLKADSSLMCGLNFTSRYDIITVKISETSEKEDKEKFKNFIDQLVLFDSITHLSNIEKTKNNFQTKTSIFKLLESVGISTKYYGYKTKQSSKQTNQYYNFPSEIGNQIPTSYSEKKLDELKVSKIKNFSDIYDRELKKFKDARIQKEKQESERINNKKLALLLAKYDLDLEHDWDDLLRIIISKNKYLNLAYWLEKNRGDWNDGYSYAENGLRSFYIESELDQDIYDNIDSYMGENWDGDGRVFRDCEYNYSVLYGMVEDKQLYNDYIEVKENVRDY